MKRKNTARNALFTSIISLLLCVSMLVGTTFAWFTDEVKSGNNVIASGNLDIDLDYAIFNENGEVSEWKTVQNSTELFDKTALWEPGHTEVTYLRMSNKGSLDLKYQLGINVTETTGTNVYNKEFKLSDYIYMGVVQDSEPKYATRDAAIAAAKNGTNALISAGYSKPGSMEAGSSDIYMAVVVYMPESVDNNANHLTGTDAPVITLGINLFATQIESENDSFGPDYDGGAPWITAAAIDWYLEDPDAETFTITSAEDLAGLAAIVNGTATAEMVTYSADSEPTTIQDSFAGKTIALAADIDLANGAWTPIGTDLPNCFSGTFDGKGYTIYNLNVQGVNNVGLFGYAANGGNVKNLTVKNATVKGNDYAGVIMGRGYTDIDKCHVENATITTVPYLTSAGIYDGGAKAGGIIGQILEGEGNTVTNCSAKNVKVYGFRDIGGVVGMVHNDNSCSGNTASNVTLGYVLCEEITADKNENAGAIYGRVQASATVSPAKDSPENQAFEMEYIASSANELKDALAKDEDISLTGNITVTGIAQMPDRNNYVEAYGNKTGIAQYGGVLDGNGYTITDATNDSYVIVTHGGTIKNLSIKNGARGIVTYSPKANVILDNVVVDGPGYALNSTEYGAVDMVVTNSTVNGWTSLAGFKSVSFTSCKLGENSTKYWQNMGYDQDYDRLFRVYSPTTYTKCEFQQGYYLDMSAGGTATLVNCTVNGTVITAANYADYITIELPAGKTLAECVTFA